MTRRDKGAAPILVEGEDAALIKLASVERSDDPVAAAYGRMMKVLLPAINAALDEEHSRETTPTVVFHAGQLCCSSLLGSIGGTLARGRSMPVDLAVRVVQEMIPALIAALSPESVTTKRIKKPAKKKVMTQ